MTATRHGLRALRRTSLSRWSLILLLALVVSACGGGDEGLSDPVPTNAAPGGTNAPDADNVNLSPAEIIEQRHDGWLADLYAALDDDPDLLYPRDEIVDKVSGPIETRLTSVESREDIQQVLDELAANMSLGLMSRDPVYFETIFQGYQEDRGRTQDLNDWMDLTKSHLFYAHLTTLEARTVVDIADDGAAFTVEAAFTTTAYVDERDKETIESALDTYTVFYNPEVNSWQFSNPTE